MADFKLQLEPAEKIVFGGKKLGEETVSVALKVTNSLKDRVAFKVKCTSNEMFRIRPPVGCLKAGESINVNLSFNAGKPIPDGGKHYFAIYFVKTSDDKKAARAAWSDHKGDPDGTKRLYVEFKKEEAGDDKKEEKKERQDTTLKQGMIRYLWKLLQ